MPTPSAQKYFNEAQKFKENGLLEKAIASYKKAIEIDPYFVSAYYTLALLYHQTQQFESAAVNLKKVIELDPNDASALNNLGVIFYVNNRLNEAKIYFEKALSLDANYKEAQDNLKKIQEKLQKAAPYSSSRQSIKYHCHKIGFVTLWYERGQAYVTRAIRDALASDHTTFIFARNGGTLDKPMLQITGEWDTPNLVTHPTYQIPHAILKNWIVNNNLDIVFFNEEYDLGLVETAKECGVKTVGYYVWELFDPQFTAACKRLYDKIICPTRACHVKFKDLGMDNVEYIQWGVDLNLFKSVERPVNNRIRFFHPAGWGGLHARRGTQFVIDAFQKLNDPNAELLIHTQNGSGIQESNNIKIISGTVPREEIIKMYQNSDVAVLPSKWEGLGLTFLEAIGCGLPIITVDAPPMNEFVVDGETGFLCKVAERLQYPGIFVEGAHVDLDDMMKKMRELIRDRSLLRKMREKTCLMSVTSWSQDGLRVRLLNLINDIAAERKAATYSSTLQTAKPTFDGVKTSDESQTVTSDTVINKALSIHSNTNSKDSLKLIAKDYTGCQLVRKDDGRQFIRKDNYEEPFTLHLVGARWSNHPWGMENELHRALEKLGITIIDTDFRRDYNRLPELFQQEAHVMLVIKGNGIPPELIKRLPCKTILWYQDDVFTAEHASKHIAHNGWAFDTVYSFDKMAIDLYRKLGVKDPRWLPLAMSPAVHRKMFLTRKKYDISFIGNIYPNRKMLLERLARKFNLFVTQAFMDDMIKIINESKIVLNLGIGPTGIQQRVFEVMGCGSFLLTNEIPEESRLFKDRVHLVYFNDANVEELAAYYLSHNEEREAIALAGYREVNNGHTFLHRIQRILDDVFYRQGLSAQTVTGIMRTDLSWNTYKSSVPTLSVVVATYNRKAYLQRCINSLLRNSKENIEIIVIDDPCDDGTREWLDSIKTIYKNIVAIHNETHEGAQRSMNIGFKAAKGQYIGLINDDVEVTKNWDSPLIALLESNPCYGTATPLILDKDGDIHSMGLIEGVLSRKYPQLELLPGLRGFFLKGKKPDQVTESKYVREVEYGYYWIMKREVWEKIGGIDESLGKYCGDPDFGMRVRLAGYKNMYCPTSVIIDHGLYIRSESAKADLKKSQNKFIAKWEPYVANTNLITHESKRHKILVVLALDKKDFNQEIAAAVNSLSHQHTVNFFVCSDLTTRMDVDVMNNLFVERVCTFLPDILLILGGKDIYPRMLRKLKRKLNLTIMLWWHPAMSNNASEMPEWAVRLNKETDVCFISGATLDYIKTAETKGVKRGFWLDSDAHIADEMYSVLSGNIKDRILLYHDEILQLANSSSEQDLLNVSKFLFEKGMGTVAAPYLEKVIQNNKDNLDAYLLLIDYFFKQGAIEKTGEMLKNALEAPRSSVSLYHQLAKISFKLGNLNEAEKWFKFSVEQDSRNSDIYNSLGQIYIQRCDFSEAERYLKTGIQEYQNNIPGLLLLGKLYREWNRIDEAISCFQQCYKIDHNRDYEDEIRGALEELYSLKKVEYDVSKILVSVIMFSYNRAEYMARSLRLFSKQSFPREAFEIIIIDSSSDNTLEVIKEAVRKYGLNIRYFFIPPPAHGLEPCISWNNKSVKQARGDVIVWTHPEVLFSEHMLEEFYKPHTLEDKLWVSSRSATVLTKEEQNKIDAVWDKGIDYILANFNLRKEIFRLGYKFWIPILVSFKKNAFLRIGGFTESLPIPRHSDLDLFFRLLAIDFSVHNPPGFQCIHQWHEPFEERGKDILPLSDKTRQIVYEWRKAFLCGKISASKYAVRNEGKEIGFVPDLKEVNIVDN